jgi:hypothetical protein
MQPPFEVIPFSEMTKKQAQEHFDWFVNEIPLRIQLLLGASRYIFLTSDIKVQ